MFDNIYFIGFGAVAHALLETFNLEKSFLKIPLIIIEPKDIKHIDLLDNRNYKHIKKGITKDNFKDLLKNINNKTLIIDLSVEVDSVMLIKYAKEKNSFYINTSVENWHDFHNDDKFKTNYDDFKDNTLYKRELEVDNILNKTKKTRIVNMGFNPGMINVYAKLGLKKYAKNKGFKLKKGNYAKLAYELGLTDIFIVEYDSQKTNIKPKKNIFYNSWSSVGMESEVADHVMLSLNNDDLKEYKKEIIKPTDGLKDTHIRFLPIRGMDITTKSITLDNKGKSFEYEGFLIPHAEIFSMSRFLQYKGNAPSIMYIYRPSDIAIKSLDNFRNNNYLPLSDYYVLESKDIKKNGYDSIGALLQFSNGEKFWAGSVLTIEQTKKMGYKISGPTTVQVAGCLYSTIDFIYNNPNYGFNEAETLPSDIIFKNAKKFMGKSYFKLI